MTRLVTGVAGSRQWMRGIGKVAAGRGAPQAWPEKAFSKHKGLCPLLPAVAASCDSIPQTYLLCA
jgi:hypothetical protein